MNSMIFIAFVGLITGAFLLIGTSPFEMLNDLSSLSQAKDESMKTKIEKITHKKKKKGLKKLLDETKIILKATNKENQFTSLCILSFTLLVMGSFVSVLMDNMFLIPVLAIGFALLPFWYVKFTAIRWKNELNSELETALSIITTSYLRSESIITAIDENIDYINPPVYDVFRAFLTQTKLINSNIKIALESLKIKVDSAVFHEWVDAIINCQEDKNIKNTLVPIVSKLSDMRIVSGELDYLMYEPIKEFVTMAILLIGNIPLMYMLNKDWYNTLMFTSVGKFILAVCGTVIFVSLAAIIQLTKPVEYKR